MRPVTRRRLLALAGAASVSGCLDGEGEDDESVDDETPEGNGEEDEEAEETTFSPEEADEFRLWLAHERPREDTNHRFDYAEGYAPSYVEGGRIEFLDIPAESYDGHLSQSGSAVHLGEFDVDTLLERVEEDDEHERAGVYEGYALVEGEDVTFAIDENAVVVGEMYETLIDTRNSELDRLEEVEPDFTMVFDELPDAGSMTGQYGPPIGGDVDAEEIHLWGHSLETPTGGDATWIFVFEEEDEVTDETVEELEMINPFGGIDESEVDGRTVRLEGEVETPDGV